MNCTVEGADYRLFGLVPEESGEPGVRHKRNQLEVNYALADEWECAEDSKGLLRARGFEYEHSRGTIFPEIDLTDVA